MPRNKSQRELETEQDLRRRLRVYAEAVQWMEKELREAVAECISYENRGVSVSDLDTVDPETVQIAPYGLPLVNIGIKAPPEVIQAIDDAPYDLYL